MISLIQGKIVSNNGVDVVVMTMGGVGYRLMVSPSAAKRCAVGTDVLLDTYLVVREDALELFGFASKEEKALFKNFLTVSGVGPKTALHLLALGSAEDITLAVGRGDIEFLTKVSGIGKKTAERIVVELREKMKDLRLKTEDFGGVSGDAVVDVVDALVTLGYSLQQARETAKKLDAKGKTSEQLLREALKSIK